MGAVASPQSHPQPPPSARDVQRTIDQIAAACKEIVEGYRWTESALYGTGGGDPSSGGGRTPTHESRPAENQAISAAERSGALRDTAKLLDAVRRVVQSEARKSRPKLGITERPDKFPPLISPHEHDRLTDAQKRRIDRGEGWGRG